MCYCGKCLFCFTASVSNQVLSLSFSLYISLSSLSLFCFRPSHLPIIYLCMYPCPHCLILRDSILPLGSPAVNVLCLVYLRPHVLSVCVLYGHLWRVLCLYGNGCVAATEERKAPGRLSYCMCNISLILIFSISLYFTMISVLSLAN